MFNNQPLLRSGLNDSKAFRVLWAALALFSFGILVYALIETYRGGPEVYAHQRASRLLIPGTNFCIALSALFKSPMPKLTFGVVGFVMSLVTMCLLFGNKI